MLENLLELVKQHAGEAIVNNPAIPNSQNDAAISAAGSSITDTFKNMISSGNIQDLANLFRQQGGNIAGSPAAQQVTGNFVQTLMSKFGLDQNAASGVAGNLIPQVLQSLVNKTNDPKDSSFNIQGILGHLTGGQNSGGVDLQNIIGQFTQGGGGGILNTIKGLFGK